MGAFCCWSSWPSAVFGAFLYFIPPFFTTPPEAFGKAMADAAPPVTDIADPASGRSPRAAATS